MFLHSIHLVTLAHQDIQITSVRSVQIKVNENSVLVFSLNSIMNLV